MNRTTYYISERESLQIFNADSRCSANRRENSRYKDFKSVIQNVTTTATQSVAIVVTNFYQSHRVALATGCGINLSATDGKAKVPPLLRHPCLRCGHAPPVLGNRRENSRYKDFQSVSFKRHQTFALPSWRSESCRPPCRAARCGRATRSHGLRPREACGRTAVESVVKIVKIYFISDQLVKKIPSKA